MHRDINEVSSKEVWEVVRKLMNIMGAKEETLLKREKEFNSLIENEGLAKLYAARQLNFWYHVVEREFGKAQEVLSSLVPPIR
jgi:hypothetical protein